MLGLSWGLVEVKLRLCWGQVGVQFGVKFRLSYGYARDKLGLNWREIVGKLGLNWGSILGKL